MKGQNLNDASETGQEFKNEFKQRREQTMEELKMKAGRNLFKEFKESQSLVTNCCKVSDTGEVLWNEGIIIDFLEKSGNRKVRIGKTDKYLRYLEDTIEETNFKEIKDLILDRMNCTEYQKERMHIIRKNIFFSEDLLKNLKEAIPDKAGDNFAEFYIGEGIFTVTPDKTFMGYWA
ncbi:MAG: hypothetical protein K0B37_08580 [Bacteroidales bacterium]|nr:hypothetical protein [Bacteroidales bacterium]